MDSDDIFYGALQADETTLLRQTSQRPTVWWLAFTAALTILASFVAAVLMIMCASGFFFLRLAGWSKRWVNLMCGRGRAPDEYHPHGVRQ